MSTAVDPQRVYNQSPPLAGINLFASDPILATLVEGVSRPAIAGLTDFGAAWGTAESFELGRLANRATPILKAFDPNGRRIDTVEFHPAYHALTRRSIAAGLHVSAWDTAGDEIDKGAMARAARLYMAAQVEAGHLSTMAMTNGAAAALAHAPTLAAEWLPRLRSRQYDPADRPAREKRCATIGLAVTEKQGRNVSAINAQALEAGDGSWYLAGHKWFVSSPMSDAFLVLARCDEAPTLFLVPRFRSDGGRNDWRLMRLKDKLGNRSNASAEVEFDAAVGWRIGEAGRGAAILADTMMLIRLDSAVVTAGLMRMALAAAVNHTRHRMVVGTALVDHPLMTRVLADMALDVVAAAALVFRLAEACDGADDDPAEAAFGRLMTPAVRYWVGKIAPALIAEAMECLGGNGVVEESRLPCLYREAPALVAADGSGNVLALEVLSILRKGSEALEDVLVGIESGLGASGKSTLNVLRAAAAVALADEGSARILTEQLAMTVAAASLRRHFPAVIADAFLETRLGRPWRSTYGMLDSRFDARAFVEYVFPAA